MPDGDAQDADVTSFDATTDPALRTWVASGDPDFPIQNLPYGAFVRDAAERPHLGVAIHDYVFDLHVAAGAGLFDEAFPSARDVLCAPVLNPLLERGRAAWRAVRERLSVLLAAGNQSVALAGIAGRALVRRADARMRLPLEVADYIDFYSSLEHATNVGTIFRPQSEPLPENWRWLPIGYHGRSSTVVCNATPVARPLGQRRDAATPEYGPTRALDFELELAFITGDGPASREPISTGRARDLIFGVALLNDWSARDIQAWEYRPLGPFLGKSFQTSLAPWIVTLDALEPYRVAARRQNPPPLAYLATTGKQTYDIALAVTLASATMRERRLPPQTIVRTNFRTMYWSMAQQLAHVASNGTRVRAGDVYGSGTISGSAPDACGSLIELTRNGTRPLTLADGSTRAYLADGDEVVMHGVAAHADRPRVGFGSVSGIVRA